MNGVSYVTHCLFETNAGHRRYHFGCVDLTEGAAEEIREWSSATSPNYLRS